MVLMLTSLFVGIVGVSMVFIGHAHEDNPRGLIELGKGNVRKELCLFPVVKSDRRLIDIVEVVVQ